MNSLTEASHPMENTTSTPGLSEDQTLFPELYVAMILWQMWPPCILLLGGFGNIATICVMHRIKDHNSSQHAFLIALAASDLTLLYSGALRHWVYHLSGVDLRDLHMLTCKLLIFLVYTSGTASAWLMTCVTVQRTLAVRWPHKIRLMCTLKRTWAVIAAVVFSVCALHVNWLIGMEIGSSDGKCYNSGLAIYDDYALVDMCVSSIVPTICLLVCDAVLSFTLIRVSSADSLVSTKVSTVNTSIPGKAQQQQQHQVSSRKKVAYSTTAMILVLSSTFLVLTLPVCVYLVWEHYVGFHMDQTPRGKARAKLTFVVTFLLWYTNSAVNFLLYCFMGTRFRGEFLSWVRCGAKG